MLNFHKTVEGIKALLIYGFCKDVIHKKIKYINKFINWKILLSYVIKAKEQWD